MNGGEGFAGLVIRNPLMWFYESDVMGLFLLHF